MTEDDKKHYTPLPTRLVELIEKSRAESIDSVRSRLAFLERATPLELVKSERIELLGDDAENLTASRQARLEAWPSKSPGAWRVSTGYIEYCIGHDTVVKAFPEEKLPRLRCMLMDEVSQMDNLYPLCIGFRPGETE